MTEHGSPLPEKKHRRSRIHRFGRGSLLAMAFLVVLASGGTLWLMDRTLTAPDWMQQRIEARLAQAMPAARVRFGDMSLVVERGWHPRVRLRNVTVETLGGVEVMAFSEFRAGLSMRALLRRQIQPRQVSLTGAFATLRRNLDGTISLRGGLGAAAPAQEAATLGELVKHLDALMSQPALHGLESAELRGLTLRYEDLRVDRAWTVDGGRLIATRSGDRLNLAADLAVLSGDAQAATLNATYTSEIGATEAEFGVTIAGLPARDIATQSPAFAWLDVLRAPISGSVRSGVRADGTLAPLNATLQIGAGAVQPNAATKPIPFDSARSYFSYDAAEGLLRFDELSVISKWVTGRAEGTAVLGGLRDGALSDLVGQFRISDLRANPQGLYPEPVTLQETELDFRLQLNPFRIDLGRAQISDQGNILLARGGLTAESDGWRLALDAHMDAIAPARIITLWPEGVKVKTRKWLVENLIGGRVTDADFALRRAPDREPRTYLAFDFADTAVRFLKTMPPITEGRGHASLDAQRFVVTLDDGVVAAPEGGIVDAGGSSFIIPDVTVRDGAPAVIRLKTQSGVTAALSLLNVEPIRAMSRAGLPVDIADGALSLEGTLALPLKKGGKPEDVRYDAQGTLHNVSSTTLVKGRTLSAERLSITASNDAVRISGQSRMDGVPFDGVWEQPIGKGAAGRSTLRGAVTLSPEALAAFDVDLPDGTVSGSGTAQLALDFARGAPPAFALESDLRGLQLSVPQIGWVKPEGQSGQLSVTGTLGAAPQIETLALSGAGLDARGGITLRQGGGLERLRIDRLQLGDWLDIPVDVIGQGPGRPAQIVVRGGALDLRRADFGTGAGGGGAGGPAPPPMQIALDRLQITDTIALTQMEGNFSTAGGLDGPFQARLNGGTQVSGRVVPRDGRSAVRVISEDAGGVFRSAGVLKQAVGGTLSLTLLPVGSGGSFDGRLTVADTRIKDAPAMAALLNAVSVVGLIEQMNGAGIYFDEVEADFRLTPDRMTLTSASATGSSMGISMDGVFATDTGQIAMQGVISPVYLINSIGSVLTRKGEGLIGFNYSLTGQAKSPVVSINPLSALTPGGLRNIFRGPQTKLPPVEGEQGAGAPNVAQDTNPPIERGFEGR